MTGTINSLLPRLWNKKFEPWRALVFWGWDLTSYDWKSFKTSLRNPSFLLLFGKHKFTDETIDLSFQEIEEYYLQKHAKQLNDPQQTMHKYLGMKPQKKKKPQKTMGDYIEIKRVKPIKPGKYRLLQKEVKYRYYIIWRGREGHFPSYATLRLVKNPTYNYVLRPFNLNKHAGFYPLDKTVDLTFPYSLRWNYEIYLKRVREPKITFKLFELANSPREVLNLDIQYSKYNEDIKVIFSSLNPLSRKFHIAKLLERAPPKKILLKLLEIGNVDTIMDLFRCLTKNSDPVLRDEAKSFYQSQYHYIEAQNNKIFKNSLDNYLNSLV